MGNSPISTLPPEVLHQVLNYLPIATLLRFSRTSKSNYSAAILALQNLRLAILPRHIHGVLAFLSSSTFDGIESDLGDTYFDEPTRNQVIIPSALPPLDGPQRSRTKCPSQRTVTPAQYREKLLQLQNALACSILSTPTLVRLSALTLHIYHIVSPSLTEILATLLPNLRDLRLNFCHPYLHDTCLPAQYWTNPVYLEPSPIWNALAGVGGDSGANLRLRKLEKLTVERAGITSFQLRKWIECNPNLRELRLRNVAGVDAEFVQWLGQYYGADDAEPKAARPARMKILALESCSSLVLDNVEQLTWLDSLFGAFKAGLCDREDDDDSALQVFSLRYSKSVQSPALCAYLESRRPGVQQITLPDGRTLAPKSRHKGSGTNEPSEGVHPSRTCSREKRHRPRIMQPVSQREGQDDGDNNVETSDINVGVHALSMDESQTQSVDDESDTSEDESTSTSPVSYLRLINRRPPRKGCKFIPNDIIEPDPDVT
ncbi:hypothetical protein A1O7_09362 [Cladophialophora yegresii CBS 114405]|uniref:F-box domain-containing protein n=1 Tax=Cladophialophora yegresii CBS 114405 TaxID=1182544 RepID=W9VM04_9EURO|nr:uncharacterized protein A1O7_09362 [Cladophialophora yegresii CBS 114405]EXJ54025.1 hypothetical protein A1O7_09362 [Cladophialophora yegresii CBS 114405]